MIQTGPPCWHHVLAAPTTTLATAAGSTAAAAALVWRMAPANHVQRSAESSALATRRMPMWAAGHVYVVMLLAGVRHARTGTVTLGSVVSHPAMHSLLPLCCGYSGQWTDSESLSDALGC